METVKEMDSSSQETSEEASSRTACLVTTIVVEVVAVVAMAAEIITTSRVILEEECRQACQAASTEEAEAEECTKVEATTRPKVVKTSKTISKIKTTTIRPSNANSSKAAEIVLMGISVPSLMGPLNCR